MQMSRGEALEVMRYFQNQANMAIDDWGGMQPDRRDLDAMTNEELMKALNEQDSVEHRHVTSVVD